MLLRVEDVPDAEDVGFAFFDGGVEIFQRDAHFDSLAVRLRDVAGAEAVRELVKQRVIEVGIKSQHID